MSNTLQGDELLRQITRLTGLPENEVFTWLKELIQTHTESHPPSALSLTHLREILQPVVQNLLFDVMPTSQQDS